MSRLAEVFGRGRKALVIYLPAGFPCPGLDEELALAALESGADVLELGFPFSDPIADGPVIQDATRRALGNGMTLSGTLDLAARIRRRARAPILLMGYANPVLAMGYGEFARRAAGSGADGAIVPDLPLAEAEGLLQEMRGRSLDLIPMAAPNTSARRLDRILESGDGFLYLVSMTGITGDLFRAEAPWRRVAEEAKRRGRLPVCVGFGISGAADAKAAAHAADGVIVGSAVVKAAGSAPDPESAVRVVRDLVAGLSAAVRGAEG